MKRIVNWLHTSCVAMLQSKDPLCCITDVGTVRGKTICARLKWEDGYEKLNEDSYYVDEHGYGIAVDLCIKDSSYFAWDWDPIIDSSGFSGNLLATEKWLREELKEYKQKEEEDDGIGTARGRYDRAGRVLCVAESCCIEAKGKAHKGSGRGK